MKNKEIQAGAAKKNKLSADLLTQPRGGVRTRTSVAAGKIGGDPLN